MSFEPITQAELLEIWRRLFPLGYTVPIEQEANGQGLDVFSQQAAQMARVAEAIAVTTQAYYLLPHSTQIRPEAAQQANATGTVQITRTGLASGAITLIAGTELSSYATNPEGVAIEGQRFALVSDVVFAAGVSGPLTANVIATRPGYQGNLPAGRITAFTTRGTASITGTTPATDTAVDNGQPDRFSQLQIGQFIRFTSGVNAGQVRRIVSVTDGSPTSSAVLAGAALTVSAAAQGIALLEFADLGLTVAQAAPTTGGVHGWLDAIGRDRNVGRAPGETDASYRLRISALDDVVSPNAVLRAIARVLTPYGIAYRFQETRDPAMLMGFVLDLSAFDLPATQGGSITPPANLLLDSVCGQVRFFIVTVQLVSIGEFGAPYDTPFPGPFPPALLNPNAWDAFPFDGFPVDYYAALAALYDAVERARAAGVCWFLLPDPNL